MKSFIIAGAVLVYIGLTIGSWAPHFAHVLGVILVP